MSAKKWTFYLSNIVLRYKLPKRAVAKPSRVWLVHFGNSQYGPEMPQHFSLCLFETFSSLHRHYVYFRGGYSIRHVLTH